MSRVSNEFRNAFPGGGGACIKCACGRTYFATADCDDEDDIHGLRKLAREDPDKYIEFDDCMSVSYAECDGRMFVDGCKCDYFSRYERFIWEHSEQIARYLVARVGIELTDAVSSARVAAAVARAVEAPGIAQRIARELVGSL